MIIDTGESNPHEEPCLACGEETAIGSVFFSDRHTVDNPDGTCTYLCSLCAERAHAHDEGLSEVRRLGGMMAIGIAATRH
jgi:hypothetical protein